MGLAISRVIRRDGYDYEAADLLELRHLGMSDLEETPNVKSSAPALGDRASWHWKVQVGRTFAAAPHQHRMPLHISRHQWRDLLRALFVVIVRALFVVIALVACIYMREVVRGRAGGFYGSDSPVAAAWLHWWALVRAAFGDGYCVLLHMSWARYARHTKDEDKYLADLICTTTYAPPRAVAWRS